jgi:hypothetical protein
MYTVIYKTATNKCYSFVAPVATRQQAILDFACFFNYSKDLQLVAVTAKLI